jgi:hypothetical protein
MATVAQQLSRSKAAKSTRDTVLVPVIADGGGGVRIVMARFPHPPHLGDRFTLGTLVWEIVREGDHTRGYVARPVHHGACAH